MTTHFVTVKPLGKSVEVNEEDSLFIQLRKAGINIKSTCGACASCGECVIKIDQGEDFLNEPTFPEKQFLGNVFHITKERLSCQTFVSGDVTIDVSDHIVEEKPKLTTKVRKKTDVEKMYEQRSIDREERLASKPKRLGGNRRPKTFTFNEDDDENKEN